MEPMTAAGSPHPTHLCSSAFIWVPNFLSKKIRETNPIASLFATQGHENEPNFLAFWRH